MKNEVSGFVLDNFFGFRRYATSHRFPVHKSLPSNTGTACYDGNKLDPLTITEGVEKSIELCSLSMLDVIISISHYQNQ